MLSRVFEHLIFHLLLLCLFLIIKDNLIINFRCYRSINKKYSLELILIKIGFMVSVGKI